MSIVGQSFRGSPSVCKGSGLIAKCLMPSEMLNEINGGLMQSRADGPKRLHRAGPWTKFWIHAAISGPNLVSRNISARRAGPHTTSELFQEDGDAAAAARGADPDGCAAALGPLFTGDGTEWRGAARCEP